MIQRRLLTPDELKSIPKGQFIVMKTGTHPMQTRLRLFLEWGITFENAYTIPERIEQEVAYATRTELFQAVKELYPKGQENEIVQQEQKAESSGGMTQPVASEKCEKRGSPYRTKEVSQ